MASPSSVLRVCSSSTEITAADEVKYVNTSSVDESACQSPFEEQQNDQEICVGEINEVSLAGEIALVNFELETDFDGNLSSRPESRATNVPRDKMNAQPNAEYTLSTDSSCSAKSNVDRQNEVRQESSATEPKTWCKSLVAFLLS